MDHFQLVERELKSRYNKAFKEPLGSSFVLAIFEYLKVVELSPSLQKIVNKHKTYFELSKDHAEKLGVQAVLKAKHLESILKFAW